MHDHRRPHLEKGAGGAATPDHAVHGPQAPSVSDMHITAPSVRVGSALLLLLNASLSVGPLPFPARSGGTWMVVYSLQSQIIWPWAAGLLGLAACGSVRLAGGAARGAQPLIGRRGRLGTCVRPPAEELLAGWRTSSRPASSRHASDVSRASGFRVRPHLCSWRRAGGSARGCSRWRAGGRRWRGCTAPWAPSSERRSQSPRWMDALMDDPRGDASLCAEPDSCPSASPAPTHPARFASTPALHAPWDLPCRCCLLAVQAPAGPGPGWPSPGVGPPRRS